VKIAKWLLVILMTLVLGSSVPLMSMAEEVENIVAFNGYPVILHDPALVADFFDIIAATNLYDTLTYPAPTSEAGVGVRPHLAVNWEASPSCKTWTFTLRKGVKFHDGSELTAEDVVFSTKRMIAIGRGFFCAYFFCVENVTAPNKYKVVFELDKPISVFPHTLVRLSIVNKNIVMQHIKPGEYGEFGDYGREWLKTHDAGSGPYVLKEHKRNQYLIADRFKDYFLGWESWEGWNPELKPIDRVLLRTVVEPATIKTLMKRREHDIVNQWQSMETYEALDKIEGIDKFFITNGLTYVLPLNSKRPPTDDIHFRRAVRYAFNYDAVLGLVPGAKRGRPVPSVLRGCNKELPLPHRDLEKAKEELKKSKYNPEEVVFTQIWSTGVANEDKICLQLQKDLAEIGIKAEIRPCPWAKFQDVIRRPETTPNGTLYTFVPYYPSADEWLYYMYHPKAVTGGDHTSHWIKDEEVGELIDQSRALIDIEERVKLYKKIQERVMSLVVGINVFEIPEIHAKQDYIIGPKEVYPVKGPNFNFWDYRIDLKRKQEIVKRG